MKSRLSIELKQTWRKIITVVLFICSFGLLFQSLPVFSAPTAGIKVSTTADEFDTGADCSLREAIESANTNTAFGGCDPGSGSETDVILLGDGLYLLTNTGPGDDTNEFGDLDIDGDVYIEGESQAGTIIDGNMDDRVFHVLNGEVVLSTMTIQNGAAPDGENGTTPGGLGSAGTIGENGENGGGIYNQGELTIHYVTVTSNKAGIGGRGGNGANGVNGLDGGGNGQIGGNGGNGGRGGYGGAIYNRYNSNLTIQFSTLVDNQSGSGGEGGTGGRGGQGGEGLDVAGQGDGGIGGGGGSGGNGGYAGYGGAISTHTGSTLIVENSTIGGAPGLGNRTGDGGNGGTGGEGGRGGDGIKQWGPSSDSDTHAGDGGEGSIAGNSGWPGKGGDGGGIFGSYNSSILVESTQIIGNQAGSGGTGGRGGDGGVGGNGGPSDEDDCVPNGNGGDSGNGSSGLQGGLPGYGGGISSGQVVEISTSTIRHNNSGVGGRGGDGGDTGNPGSPGQAEKCVEGNKGVEGNGGNGGNGLLGGRGGGIYTFLELNGTVDPNLLIHSSTIWGNTAGAGGDGGDGGRGDVTGVAGFGGNAGDGGGLYVKDGLAELNNSTISGNRADSQVGLAGSGSGSPPDGQVGDGGGLYIEGPEDVGLYNVTVASNIAGLSGAFYGSLTAGHTIFADNLEDGSTPSDCWSQGSNGITSNDYLLIKTLTCTVMGTTTHNIYNQESYLIHLADNGGPTLTHALLKFSPAIDAGAAACYDSNGSVFNTDQRGSTRPVDTLGMGTPHCDIGAYEFPPMVYLPIVIR